MKKEKQEKQTETHRLFSQRDLFRLIIPLIIETFLNMTIGFIGMIMVAAAGQSAVSAVSLVDNINMLIMVFVGAIATGGAIIIAQYIGKGSADDARSAAKQLLYTTVLISVFLMGMAMLLNKFLLRIVFGEIEPEVMTQAQVYFFITAMSYPFLAVQNSVSAVFRSMGISRTPMLVTLMVSVVNIVCCAVLIYIFEMGVMGAAIALTASRVIAAAVLLLLIRSRGNAVFITKIFKFKLNFNVIKSILRVGIPSGLDSGMFQLGRVVMQSLIATFGTASIAANAVTGQILNIVYIPSTAIQMAVITVIGQCVGAGDHKQASSYAKRLIFAGYSATALLCGIAFLLLDTVLPVFNLNSDAYGIAVMVLRYSLLFSALLHPLSFIPPNALRAAGDVKYTMIVSVVSMWLVRVCLSYIIEYTFHLGIMSVWFAMYADWFVRGTLFLGRWFSGRWKKAVKV